MKRIGVFGGSFNPVHLGHTIVAAYMAELGGFDEVWLTLTPLNPLKADIKSTFASDADRMAMLEIALEGATKLKACDIELSLPRPNFTINTLRELERLYPDVQFTPIIGSDNWEVFDRWASHDEILDRYGVVVYPREGHDAPPDPKGRSRRVEAPRVELSSTFVRDAVARGLDVNFFVPKGVSEYITQHNLYR